MPDYKRPDLSATQPADDIPAYRRLGILYSDFFYNTQTLIQYTTHYTDQFTPVLMNDAPACEGGLCGTR